MRLALIACIIATLVHLAWVGAAAAGLCGYALLRRGWRFAGYGLLLAFGAYALDGLLHYALAPVGMHSLAMNATIVAEAVTGTLLALAVVHHMVTR